MLWFILALASTVSAGKIPCEEPDRNVSLPSECPPGQVLHKGVCRSYFQLRSDRRACLLSEDMFLAKDVPLDEIICPLSDKTSDCNLYRADAGQCLSFDFPSETQPPCNEYDAQGEYDQLKDCAELTDGIPLSGIEYKFLRFPTTVYPAIVATHEGKCPLGYCPTNADKCIRWGKKKYTLGVAHAPGALEPSDKTSNVNHGPNPSVTNAGNLREHAKDWHGTKQNH